MSGDVENEQSRAINHLAVAESAGYYSKKTIQHNALTSPLFRHRNRKHVLPASNQYLTKRSKTKCWLQKNVPLPALAHQLPARPKSTPPSCSSWQGKGRAGCSPRTLMESGVGFSAGDLGRRTCVLNATEARVSKYYENKWVIHHWANNHTTPKPGTEWLCRALPEGEKRLSQQWKQNWCGEKDFTFHWFGLQRKLVLLLPSLRLFCEKTKNCNVQAGKMSCGDGHLTPLGKGKCRWPWAEGGLWLSPLGWHTHTHQRRHLPQQK